MRRRFLRFIILSLGISASCSTTTLNPRPGPVESALYQYARETGRGQLLYDRWSESDLKDRWSPDPDLKVAARGCDAQDEHSCGVLLSEIRENEKKRRDLPNVVVHVAVCEQGRGDACADVAELLRGEHHFEDWSSNEGMNTHLDVMGKPYTEEALSYQLRACLAERRPESYACSDVAQAALKRGKLGEALFYARRGCALCNNCLDVSDVVTKIANDSPSLRKVLFEGAKRLKDPCPAWTKF